MTDEMVEKTARKIFEVEKAKQPPPPIMTSDMVEKAARRVFEALSAPSYRCRPPS